MNKEEIKQQKNLINYIDNLSKQNLKDALFNYLVLKNCEDYKECLKDIRSEINLINHIYE